MHFSAEEDPNSAVKSYQIYFKIKFLGKKPKPKNISSLNKSQMKKKIVYLNLVVGIIFSIYEVK